MRSLQAMGPRRGTPESRGRTDPGPASRTLAGLGLCLVACLALAACSKPATPAGQKAVDLLLDWYPNADHAPIAAALDQGDFASHGLDVHLQTPSDVTDALQLVAAGKVPFAIGYEYDVLAARTQGIPVQAVFALVQVPLNCIITLQSSGITHPAQLEGKKVGMAGLPSDTAILDSVLRADGADPAKVTSVDVGTDLVQSLLSGKVDAIVGGYWNWEAVQLQQEGEPVNVIKLDRWGVPTYNELVVMASDATVKGDPGLIQAFDAGLAEGETYAIAHPSVTEGELLRLNSSLSRPLIHQSLQLLQPAWLGSAPEVGYMDPQAWQAYANWMVQQKLVDKAPDVSAAMTDAFVPQ